MYTLTASATSTTGRAYVTLQNIGHVVDFYGLQSEQQSFATSYIPTSGSTVTRNEDVCNNAGSSDLINSTEGVLYTETACLVDGTSIRAISVGSDNNNYASIQYNQTIMGLVLMAMPLSVFVSIIFCASLYAVS